MNNFDFTGYMRNVAVQLKDIGHVENDKNNMRFYRVSGLDKMEELINNFSILKEFVLVVEDNAEGRLTQGNSIFDIPVCSFFLLKKAELNNADDREAMKNDCKAAMKKILSRMHRDYISDNKGDTDLGIRNIDFGSWQYNTFGPVLNTCYGINVVFALSNSMDLQYNESDWNG